MKRSMLDENFTGYSVKTSSSAMEVCSSMEVLSPALQHILKDVQREIGYGRVEGEGVDYEGSDWIGLVTVAAERFGFELTNYERDLVVAQIEREQRPFGILQELVDDASVSDIIVAGYNNVTVQQGRRNFSTNIVFPSQENYQGFIEKLLIDARSSYSTKKPIADGMIGSFARVHAVHKSIADDGPYLTIRLNRFSTVTLQDLEHKGLAPSIILNYLRSVIQAGCTVLISGEVGTGKTTLARALAATMPTTDSILVIEDTPEIRLEHPNVRYVKTREANNDGAGRVTPSECIRGGMRMAMNRIVFGEIRDSEAAESFIDVCASGHPGLSTIHARNAKDTVARLELFLGRAQKGVAQSVLRQQISTAVHVIVHVDICKLTNRRRVMEVMEIGSVADGSLQSRTIFRYGTEGVSSNWNIENRISSYRDKLEALSAPFLLSSYPSNITLDSEQLLRDALSDSDWIDD